MDNNSDPVYSRNVVEFVAVANEFCKYAEHASELKGDELLKISSAHTAFDVPEGLSITTSGSIF